jgi:glycogen(starch) synthase
MRILTVGNMFPPLSLGGYELIWESAVEHLRASGHEVAVLTTRHGVEEAGGEADDTHVHRELDWYWRDHAYPRLSPLERLGIELRNAAALRRHLRVLDPDVVCWWSMGGMSLSLIEVARRDGRPAAAVLCDEWLSYAPHVDGWTRMFAARPRAARLAALATGIPTAVDLADVGPCLFLSRALLERAPAGLALEHTEVCRRGVDRELFTPRPARNWSWSLAYVGRIDPRKGIDTAILAMTMLPAQATLDVVGGGDEDHLSELRSLAKREGVGDRVRFRCLPRERVPDAYGAADAVLFPVRWQEPWGLVPLEAMATGTPVVATGTGGSGEYLDDGENCLLFAPTDDPGALAGAVRRLESEPELRARLRARGLETSGRFSEEEFNEAVARLVERAAGGPPTGAGS